MSETHTSDAPWLLVTSDDVRSHFERYNVMTLRQFNSLPPAAALDPAVFRVYYVRRVSIRSKSYPQMDVGTVMICCTRRNPFVGYPCIIDMHGMTRCMNLSIKE